MPGAASIVVLYPRRAGRTSGAQKMRDDVSFSASNGGDVPVFVHLADQIVTLLGSRPAARLVIARDDVAAQLEAAVCGSDAAAMGRLMANCRRLRINTAILADVYIPEVARRLGQGWLDDRLSFVDVSQGAARLQVLLRDLNGRWRADQAETPDIGEILLIVPQEEQHTLGAMVAMGQMRRLGVSVCLRFAPSRDALATLMIARNFDGVFISLSAPTRLEKCKELISSLKSFGGGLPVIVGGPVNALCDAVLTASGADGVTDNIHTALALCGILVDAQAARLHA